MISIRRTVFNVVIPYGRSVAALVCGLFTARWVLGGLGPVEYGLLGVIVGMAGFVSVVSTLLASALARFYAVAIGADDVSGVRAWFSTGVVLLGAAATLLTVIGYPIGSYAIRHWLTVPPSCITDCLWAWRWSCLGCWVGMAVAPWQAMYTARQRLVPLSGYAFAALLANVALAAWVAMRPGRWLVFYAAGLTLIGIVQNGVILVRARSCFKECRFSSWTGLGARAGELLRYSLLNSVQALGWLLSNNGMALLVNKLCGPIMNGAWTLSNSVKTHSSQLSNAVQGAFSPVIATAYGAGDMDGVRHLALRVSKLAVVSVVVFALPLAVVLREVLTLWLKTPPEGTWELCLMALAVLLADAFGVGYRTAIYASGKIGRFAACGESVILLTLPLAGVMWYFGWGVWAIGGSYLLITLVNVGARIFFARQILGTSVRAWMKELALPAIALVFMCCGVGLLTRSCLSSEGLRVFLVAGIMELVMVPFAWFLMFNRDERSWVRNRLWK